MPKKLETMDAETLMTTPMEPLKFIISGLLPQGLHVLAGSPKIGKSWLSLWICLQVAKGEKVWEFETLQSEVLYLCLEDSFARIQSRLFEITDEAPPTLHFAIMSDAIGNGLEIQIEEFLKEHPRTRLIVIDTLQKVRKTVSANVNPYAADYDDINALKQIADKHRIAIVLVHYLRKTGDADPLNMISGTSCIAGGADSNFVLQKDKRTENTATLICTGRDIEGQELFLEFNRYTFVWELLSPIPIDVMIIPDELFLLSDFVKSQDSFLTTMFGGWNTALTTLVFFMTLDYITGLVMAGVLKKSPKRETGALQSRAGWKGLCQKGVTLAVVFVAHRLDISMGLDFIKDTAIIAFIANETISIIENAGLMGVPIPSVITKAIDILKQKADSREGKKDE